MLRFAADENFNNKLLQRLQRDIASIDIVRIQDGPAFRAGDEAVLEWAAAENRILLTHDLSTIPNYAYERIDKGLPMPGVFAVSAHASHSSVSDDLLIIAECSLPNEWTNRIAYIPLK